MHHAITAKGFDLGLGQRPYRVGCSSRLRLGITGLSQHNHAPVVFRWAVKCTRFACSTEVAPEGANTSALVLVEKPVMELINRLLLGRQAPLGGKARARTTGNRLAGEHVFIPDLLDVAVKLF